MGSRRRNARNRIGTQPSVSRGGTANFGGSSSRWDKRSVSVTKASRMAGRDSKNRFPLRKKGQRHSMRKTSETVGRSGVKGRSGIWMAESTCLFLAGTKSVEKPTRGKRKMIRAQKTPGGEPSQGTDPKSLGCVIPYWGARRSRRS